MPRYLTKSLFTTALDCPTRLYYAKKPEYPSVKDEDLFLQSLAEGGMQVGELACMYHPGGQAITTLDSRKRIELIPGTTADDLGEPILTKVNVTESVQAILDGRGIAEKDMTPIQKLVFGNRERSGQSIPTGCSRRWTLRNCPTTKPAKSLSPTAAAP